MILSGNLIATALEKGHWKAYEGERRLPFSELAHMINPNSINVTLGSNFIELKPGIAFVKSEPDDKEWWETEEEEKEAKKAYLDHEEWVIDPYDCDTLAGAPFVAQELVIRPMQFFLGHAVQRFDCAAPIRINGRPHHFAPMFEARSSFARMGLLAHLSAGFGDYAFNSSFTSEIANIGPAPVRLRAGMEFAQVSFNYVYGGLKPQRYTGQYNRLQHSGPAAPIIGRDKFDPRVRSRTFARR